jgi:hypothetical protein
VAGLAVTDRRDTTALERLVDDFLSSCRARGLSPATIHRGYGHPLRRVFVPWCAANDIADVSQLSQRVLDRFTASLLDQGGTLGRPLSRFSVHSYARTVASFSPGASARAKRSLHGRSCRGFRGGCSMSSVAKRSTRWSWLCRPSGTS